MCWGCPDPTSERIAQPRIKPNRLDFLATASALWMMAIPAWWRPAHLHEVHPDNCGVIPMGGARAVRRGWRALLKVLHSLQADAGQNDVDLYAKRTARDRMAGICGRRPFDPRHWACRRPRPGARRVAARRTRS